MASTFLTGLSTEVKPYIDGWVDAANTTRYAMVNSRNYNRKIIRSAGTLATQKLGIDYPTVAPTGTGGSDVYCCYVYVNHTFIDPLAVDPDPYIRSVSSPVSAQLQFSTSVSGTASTDTQVTHVWLYVSADAAGPFYRLATNYEVANTGTPTWTLPSSVDTTQPVLEENNYPPDTCRIVCENAGYFLYAGFVPISTTASATIGSSSITASSGVTFPDGILALNLQFSGDTTGGPSNAGVHIANYQNSTTLQLLNSDGTARNYDGPTNKTDVAVRIWRSQSVIQVSKRWNMDFYPGLADTDFLIRALGPVTGIAKPTTGYAVRVHTNTEAKKSVEILDMSQGIPPRRYTTASAYAMSNPRAWVSAGNRMFYYDQKAGVIEDKGMQHVPMTLPVIPNLMRSLAGTSADISEMEYDETRNLLFLSVVPSGYAKGYYLIVYNLTTNTWNLWFMLPDVLSMRRFTQTDGSVVIKFGSSKGSITTWPSTGFNEAVGNSIYGNLASQDDSTHLQAIGTPFPTSGDSLIDRWVMVWDDTQAIPTYQFARIASNTSSRLTLDTFIGSLSTTEFSPIPDVGWAYWCGPIQSILGPNWDFNSVPDDDGHLLDFSVTSGGLPIQSQMRLELHRNLESTATQGSTLVHAKYADGTLDPDHSSAKFFGDQKSIEATGITGWRLIDNNECALSLKSIVRRVQAVSDQMNRGRK